MYDEITKPHHYMQHPSGIESIKIAELAGFNLGNAIKYLYRHEHKGDPANDLKKARFYLQRITKLDAFEIETRSSHNPDAAINLVHQVTQHEPEDTPLFHALKLLENLIFSADTPVSQTRGPAAIEAINKKLETLETPTRTPTIYEEQ